jgi:hypothetical protein
MHDGSVRVLSEPEFDEMCKRAEDEANVYRPEFWEDDDEPDAVSSEISNGANSAVYRASGKLEAEPLLMRPVIYPGKLHFIYSFRGLGKTSFAISLCASIVSGNKFLEGRVWTPPARGKGEFRKVVYFLLEEKDDPSNLMRQFGVKYMPTDKKQRDACTGNFRILQRKDIGNTDLTDEANHDNVVRILDSMFTEGSSERKVDLVVFDTYDVIVGGPDYMHKFNLVKPLLDRIMSNGTAVLVIAHTDQPGRNGKLRGGSAKEDGVSCSFKLWRDPGARSKTLDSPLFVSIEKPSKIACGLDCEDFSVKHTDGEWRVCLDSTVSVENDGTEVRDEDFEICSNCDGSECGTACDGRCNAYCKVARSYKDSNYKGKAIAEMMGYAAKYHYEVLGKCEGAVSKAKIKAEAERSRKAKATASAKGN